MSRKVNERIEKSRVNDTALNVSCGQIAGGKHPRTAILLYRLVIGTLIKRIQFILVLYHIEQIPELIKGKLLLAAPVILVIHIAVHDFIRSKLTINLLDLEILDIS